MRIVYPESRRFRISFVVERVCRSANTGCPVPSRDRIFCAVSARAAFRGCVRPLFPEPVRDGAGRGWFRAFVCPVVCRVLTICKHVPTCPDKGARPGGRRAPGPLLFPRLTPSLFFSAGIAAGSGAAVILFSVCRSAAGEGGDLRAASSGVPYAGEVGFSPARLRGYGLVWPGC